MINSDVKFFSLSNINGVKISVLNFGARIISLLVPDKNGKHEDIVLGYDIPEKYVTHHNYFGAIIGRYANRIAKGKFSIGEKSFQLKINNGGNALHGGPNGFHNVFWNVEASTNSSVTLSYLSPDGDEDYPGNLKVKVTYVLNDNNELSIDYEATTDQATIINLTSHPFFNLKGEGKGDILEHELMINASRFCPVDETMIPTGELINVIGSPFDFLTIHKIGDGINQNGEQLKFGNGYDHTWVLNKNGNELSLAAKVIEPTSGRSMEVWTTEPGIQFYSGNFLSEKEIGKTGKPYQLRSGLCLEAQHFPDSPNYSNFPPTILNVGEVYKQKTIYRFSVL